jgi:HEPN domain-containing protein
MASADPPLDAICFHAHACVEKLLKALIVSGGAYPPRTHVLPQLLARQAAHVRDDRAIAAACDSLQMVYPGSRYADQPMPTLEQARTALESARVVRDRVLPLLETK